MKFKNIMLKLEMLILNVKWLMNNDIRYINNTKILGKHIQPVIFWHETYEETKSRVDKIIKQSAKI